MRAKSCSLIGFVMLVNVSSYDGGEMCARTRGTALLKWRTEPHGQTSAKIAGSLKAREISNVNNAEDDDEDI